MRSHAVLRRSSLKYDTQNFGPWGRGFPVTIYTIQTDYDGLGAEVDTLSRNFLKLLIPQMTQAGLTAFNTLVRWRSATIEMNQKFRDMQTTASGNNNSSFDQLQRNLGTAITITRAVRDISATAVLVGASALSGGAAAAAIGAGSTLKGIGSFEDDALDGKSMTTAAADGLMEAGTDAIVGVIGLGKGAAMVVIGAATDGTSEYVKATISGKSVKQALISASLTTGVDLASLGMDKLFKNSVLSKLSFPITVTKGSKDTVKVGILGTEALLSVGADWLGNLLTSNSNQDSAAWHQSVAITFPAHGDSDMLYVEQHAMCPAKS